MGARTFPARRNSNGPLGSDDACGNDKTLPMYPWAVACVTQSESQSHQRMRIRADAWRHSAVKAEANDGERPDLMNRGLRVSTRARQARTAPSLSLLEIPGTALRAREGGVEWRRTDARRPRSPVPVAVAVPPGRRMQPDDGRPGALCARSAASASAVGVRLLTLFGPSRLKGRVAVVRQRPGRWGMLLRHRRAGVC
jgi:hypothetical protein